MDERVIECGEAGGRWKVIAVSRSSYHRTELVFQSLQDPDRLLRGEAPAKELAELTDDQLCFLLRELL